MVDTEIESLLEELEGAMEDLDEEELAVFMEEDALTSYDAMTLTSPPKRLSLAINCRPYIKPYRLKYEEYLKHEKYLEYCKKRCIELKDEICEKIRKQADEINKK